MQFLIDVGPPSARARFSGDFAPADSKFFPGAVGAALRIETPELAMTFALPEGDPGIQFWSDENRSDSGASFVYVLGWCYRIGSQEERLGREDLMDMLSRHRAGLPPADGETSGNYLVVVRDGLSGRISVQPDQYALSAVHFGTARGRAVVSNRAALVASALEAPLDGFSVFSLLRGTHFPFGRSLFGGVQRVLSGTFLEIDPKDAAVKVRRSSPLYLTPRDIGRRGALELVCESVESVIGRVTTTESTVCDLTGGKDTRLFAAGVRKSSSSRPSGALGWNVVGPESHPDVVIARQIAAMFGWPLRRLDRVPPPDADEPELVRAAVLSDGSCMIDDGFSRLKLEEQRGPWTWLSGAMGGESLRGFWWGQEFLALGRTSRVNYQALLDYRIRPSRAMEGSLFGSGWPSLADHDQVLLGPYRAIGDAGGDRVNTYKLDVILQHRLGYSAGNAYSWLAGVRRIRLPFVSWEFCRAALSIPWRLRFTRQLQLRAIESLCPALARLPDDTGTPVMPLGWSSLPLYGRRAVADLRRGAPLVTARLLRRLKGRKAAVLTPPPQSWITVFREARHLPVLFDKTLLGRARGQQPLTSDSLRLFQALLTLELLFRGLPRLRKEFVFWEANSIVT